MNNSELLTKSLQATLKTIETDKYLNHADPVVVDLKRILLLKIAAVEQSNSEPRLRS